MRGTRRSVLSIRRLARPSTLRLYLAARNSPRSATASPATRCPAEAFRRRARRADARSARSIRPTSRPIPETGIGRWSEAAFSRAMREGVDREGNHLYPGLSLRPFHARHRRGQPRPLRLSDDARAGRSRGAGERAAVPAQHPHARSPAGSCSISTRARFQPDSDRARNGTAAPISPRASAIAAPATRRATGSARRRRRRISPAARRKAGPPMPSTRPRRRPFRGTATASPSISATAGMSSTACRAGRWRR